MARETVEELLSQLAKAKPTVGAAEYVTSKRRNDDSPAELGGQVLKRVMLARVDAMCGMECAGATSRLVVGASKRLVEKLNMGEELVRAAMYAAKICNKHAQRLSARSRSAAVEVLCALDAVYHELRYLSVLSRSFDTPSPREYFCRLLDPCTETPDELNAERSLRLRQLRFEITDAAATFLRQHVSRRGARSIAGIAWELLLLKCQSPRRSGGWNPLLAIFRCRWRESAWLLSDEGGWLGEEEALMPSEPEDAGTMKHRDPIATHSTRLWRRSVRDWTAREYSYAVPSEAALRLLAQWRIIEVGAGTGYWSRCLAMRGGDTEAYDPDRAEYHGRFDTFATVLPNDADHVLSHLHIDERPLALLVCYPPPSRESFLGTIARKFATLARLSDRLALVGEWRGDTASLRCLQILVELFVLDQRVPLPNWGDTSAELTLWTVPSSTPAASVCPLDACSVCKQPSRALKRCRVTCDLDFCSQMCLSKAATARADLVALKIFLPAAPGRDIADPAYFRRIRDQSASRSSRHNAQIKSSTHAPSASSDDPTT